MSLMRWHPVSSSNFLISEPWHLSLLHTDLKQKRERRIWFDWWFQMRIKARNIFASKPTNQRQTLECVNICAPILPRKEINKWSVPHMQNIYESFPNAALQPKLFIRRYLSRSSAGSQHASTLVSGKAPLWGKKIVIIKHLYWGSAVQVGSTVC